METPSFALFFESIQSLEEFKKNLLGAFRIVFDLDAQDIDNDSLHTPLSRKMGLRNYSVSYDYRCPSNANNAVSVYFPLTYKAKVYIVDARIFEWNEMPTIEDFNKCARGIDLKNSFLLKKPINTDSIFTATGDVKIVDLIDPEDEMVIGSLEVPYSGENFNQFLIRDSNMINFAKRVKQIIDGRDRDKKEKPSPMPSAPSKKPTTLVGV